MNEAPGFAWASLGRSLTISGIVSVIMLLAIPVSALVPGGQVVGQILTIVWAASLVFVAVGAHRLAGRGRSTRLIVTIAGVVGMGVIAIGELVSIVGLSTPLGVAPFTAPALVLSGLWLDRHQPPQGDGRIPARARRLGRGRVGGAERRHIPALARRRVSHDDRSVTLSSMSPVTIVAAMLSLLSVPLYAVWAIWAARRLPKPA